MNLHQLPKITSRKAKVVGRGIGSGKGGHTTGRGNKGQKARERVTIWFEGTKNKKALIQRLPLLRGKNKFKPWGDKFVAVSIDALAEWPVKTPVTNDALVAAGIIRAGEKAKLLGGTTVRTDLKVEIPTSKSLAEKLGTTTQSATAEEPAKPRTKRASK